MTSGLQDAVCVVTGAARGIGRAIVEQLWTTGARVVPVDVDRAVTALPGAVVADLRDETAIEELVGSALNRYGRWDVLVNNAGVARHDPIGDVRTDDLDLMWSVNVRATILLTRAAFRVLPSNGGGQVLNVVSTAGLRGEPGESVYCATKAAVRGFTEAAAEEGRLLGIRVHGLYPAGVDTGFWRDATAEGPGVDPGEVFLRPEDVAAAAVHALAQPAHMHSPEVVVRALLDADTVRTAAKLERFRRPAMSRES